MFADTSPAFKILRLPAIPTPPATVSAPVVVEVLDVAEFTLRPALVNVATTLVLLIPPPNTLVTVPPTVVPITKLPPGCPDTLPWEYRYASLGNKLVPKLLAGMVLLYPLPAIPMSI